MADKWTALNSFWNGFGLRAYDEHTVPDEAQTPYITYEASTADINEKVPLTASLWYKSNSWAEVSRKAEEISDYIGGGAGQRYDNGRLWVTKEAPFAQRMEDPDDLLIRRIILQIAVEYQ